MSGLYLKIVTPHGRVLNESEVAKVVVRRFEEQFRNGGQVIFLPHHGSETVHLGPGPISYISESGETVRFDVGGGFAEIEQDRVTVLTPSASRVADSSRQRRCLAFNTPCGILTSGL